jgi:hypothetical protein
MHAARRAGGGGVNTLRHASLNGPKVAPGRAMAETTRQTQQHMTSRAVKLPDAATPSKPACDARRQTLQVGRRASCPLLTHCSLSSIHCCALRCEKRGSTRQLLATTLRVPILVAASDLHPRQSERLPNPWPRMIRGRRLNKPCFAMAPNPLHDLLAPSGAVLPPASGWIIPIQYCLPRLCPAPTIQPLRPFAASILAR